MRGRVADVPPTQMQHVTHDDGLHDLAWGRQGPPVVLVHGLDGSAANWLPVGQRLEGSHRVLAPDLHGFGRSGLAGSSPLPPSRGASIADHAALVAERIEELDAGPVALAGNSMGGVVALLVAARRPELVRRCVLVASALPRPGAGDIDSTLLPAWLTLWTPGAGALTAVARSRQEPDERVRRLLRLCLGPGSSVPDDAMAEMVDVAGQRDARTHRRAWTATARSLWTHLLRRSRFHATVDAVQAPGVLLTGAADPIIPSASADAFAVRHPDWSRTDLPGVGHVPPLEAPDAVVAALEAD